MPGRDPAAVVGLRVGQYVLDSLLTFLPFVLVFGVAAAVFAPEDGSGRPPGAVFVLVLVGSLVLLLVTSWFLHAWWPFRRQGQTPAMRWLRLRIVAADGRPLGLGALTARWLLLIVDFQLYGLVGLVIMIADSRHRRVGDLAADTLVVRA